MPPQTSAGEIVDGFDQDVVAVASPMRLAVSPTPPPDDDSDEVDTGKAADMLRATADRSATHSTEFYSPMPTGYRKGQTKYVVVFGTVMSGLGKGIFSA